ncbi:unnamed protein product [Paramecium sonneborni]|uniref:Uncharacterized protein n=1 Tax=Paramecium sonneborni TaxID=65129 RepID=A0A8S1M886_9CILI|nr:unnamed protein product [Paramecium sonneborni]
MQFIEQLFFSSSKTQYSQKSYYKSIHTAIKSISRVKSTFAHIFIKSKKNRQEKNRNIIKFKERIQDSQIQLRFINEKINKAQINNTKISALYILNIFLIGNYQLKLTDSCNLRLKILVNWQLLRFVDSKIKEIQSYIA